LDQVPHGNGGVKPVFGQAFLLAHSVIQDTGVHAVPDLGGLLLVG
jgi:hypothetical protein